MILFVEIEEGAKSSVSSLKAMFEKAEKKEDLS